MDTDFVRKIIEKKYPHILIDKITAFQAGESITAVKNISASDVYFGPQTDFTVPGSILLEIMAQVCRIGIFASNEEEKEIQFIGVNNFKITRNASPGDSLIVMAQISRLRISAGEVRCEVFGGRQKICEANLIFSFE